MNSENGRHRSVRSHTELSGRITSESVSCCERMRMRSVVPATGLLSVLTVPALLVLSSGFAGQSVIPDAMGTRDSSYCREPKNSVGAWRW